MSVNLYLRQTAVQFKHNIMLQRTKKICINIIVIIIDFNRHFNVLSLIQLVFKTLNYT